MCVDTVLILLSTASDVVCDFINIYACVYFFMKPGGYTVAFGIYTRSLSMLNTVVDDYVCIHVDHMLHTPYINCIISYKRKCIVTFDNLLLSYHIYTSTLPLIRMVVISLREKYASRDRTGNNTPDYLENKFILRYDILPLRRPYCKRTCS